MIHPLFSGQMMVHECVSKAGNTPKEGWDKFFSALNTTSLLSERAKVELPDDFSIVYTGHEDHKPETAGYDVFQPYGQEPVSNVNAEILGEDREQDFAYLQVARRTTNPVKNGMIFFQRLMGEELIDFFNRIINRSAEEYNNMQG